MFRFLVYIDPHGEIEQVKWCHPEGSIIKGMSLIQFLGRDFYSAMAPLILETATEECCRSLSGKITNENNIVPVLVFIMRIGTNIAVLGLGGKELDINLFNNLISIYNEHANQVRNEFKRAAKIREDSIRTQFEEIQKLNNELTNTRRMLEKANARLTHTNQELNSQLVKDALTGLVSRYQYWIEINTRLTEDPGKLGLFVFIDLDDFKSVNDRYGHTAGDKYLIGFAERLKTFPVPDAIRIRISGDEFALFIYGVDHVNQAYLEGVEGMLKTFVLSGPLVIDGNEIPVSFSAGLAVYGVDSSNLSQLIEYADFAMYQAKAAGKGKIHHFNAAEYTRQYTRHPQKSIHNRS